MHYYKYFLCCYIIKSCTTKQILREHVQYLCMTHVHMNNVQANFKNSIGDEVNRAENVATLVQ